MSTIYSNNIRPVSGTTDAISIDSANNILVGKSSDGISIVGNEIRPNGSQFSTCDFTSTGTEIVIHNTTASSGGAYATSYRIQSTEVGKIAVSSSGVAYNTSSDYRLKENLVGLDGALERLSQLKTYRFNFISDPDTTVDGFVAHEVSDVVPEAVTGEKGEMEVVQMPVEGAEPDELGVVETEDVEQIKPQGIDQSKLVPLLTAALQESIAKIEALEARVAALESQA